jgi:hypothetical protein
MRGRGGRWPEWPPTHASQDTIARHRDRGETGEGPAYHYRYVWVDV